jgi:carboxypeptidase T
VHHGRWRLATGLALAAALMAPGVASAKTTLVEVQSTSHAVLNQLESLGLDVTYEGDTRTELMLHGPEDVQILKDSGVAYDVLDEDIDGANDARLKTEDDHQTKVDKGIAPLSTLPTGRVAYRDLASINAELQQLATTYPDKVKLFTLNKTSLLGKTIYGVEVSHNVAGRRRRQRPEHARADARRTGDLRRVHSGHREGVRRVNDRDDGEHRGQRGAERRRR